VRGGSVTDTFPLSLSQRSILDLRDLVPDLVTNPHYTLSVVLNVVGPLDLDRLGDATDDLIARQDVLRTRCVEVGGEMVQQVLGHRARAGRSALTVLDGAGPANPDGHGPDVSALAAAPVAWDEPPILRVLARRLARDEHLVAVVVHHLSVDATSLHLAVDELARGYEARAGGGRPPAPPPLRYGDYAAWQAQRLAARFARDREAWTGALAGARPPSYRRDHPFVLHRPAACRAVRTELLDPAGLAAVDDWSRRHRSTTFATLLAAFVRTLALGTDDRDLFVLTVFEQRDHPGTKGLLGAFIHPAVVRVAVEDDEPWDRLVARARNAVVDTYARAQFPLEHQLSTNLALLPGAIGLAPPWIRFLEYLPARGEDRYRFGPATGTVVESSGHQLASQEHGLGLRTRRTRSGALVGRLNVDTHELTDERARGLIDDFRRLLGEVARS
jgi:hypothetical protein